MTLVPVPRVPPLSVGLPAVAVGVASVAAWHPRLDALLATLDARERERAAAFVRPLDAERFVVAHGLLRRMAGAALGRAPGALSIGRDPDGRPRVDDAGGFRCSLSHAGDRVAVAISTDMPVGVDVEPIDPRRADPAVAARYLAPTDIADLGTRGADDRARAFAQAWTRLEAEAKGRRCSLDELRGRSRRGSSVALDVGDGHVGALWTPGPARVLRRDPSC